jgi:hypothetical protein
MENRAINEAYKEKLSELIEKIETILIIIIIVASVIIALLLKIKNLIWQNCTW